MKIGDSISWTSLSIWRLREGGEGEVEAVGAAAAVAGGHLHKEGHLISSDPTH